MDYKQILKGSIITGLFAILIVPFIVSNGMYFPYIVGKAFTFRIIVEIIFALWLILIFKDKESRLKFSWVALIAFLFVAVMFIADIFGVAPAKSIWSNFERMDGWMTLIHLLMYLFVFTSVIKADILLWFLRSSIGLSIIMGVSAISQSMKSENVRVDGPLGNPIYLAIYFLFNFFFALILIYRDCFLVCEKKGQNFSKIFSNSLFYIYSLVALLNAYGIYITQTRGVILGLLGGLFVMVLAIVIFERQNKAFRNIALGGIVAVVVLVAGFFAIKNTDFVKNQPTLARLASISWSNVSGQARQYVWPMAIKGAIEKPVLGWGQENFNYIFNKYYDPRMYGQEQWFDRAHNMPLDMLVAGGILGFLLYIGLYFAALYELWKKTKNFTVVEKSIITGLLAGYFFQSIFVFDNNVSLILFFTVLAIIHVYSGRESEKGIYVEKISKWADETGKNDEAINYIIIPLAIVALFITLYFVNYKPMQTNYNLISAVRIQDSDPASSLDFYQKAVTNGFLGKAEVRERMLDSAPTVYKGTKATQDVKNKFIDFAYAEIKKQVETYPNDARYQEFFGVFLASLGDFNQALTYLKEAEKLSPSKQVFKTQIVNAYLNLGQIDNMVKEAKASYDLGQNFIEAKIIYGVSLVFSQDQKNFDAIWGDATTSDSRIPSAYIALAKGYYDQGSISTAINFLGKAKKINPDMTSQIENMISSIYKGIDPF